MSFRSRFPSTLLSKLQGLLTLAPGRHSPAEHASLRWTQPDFVLSGRVSRRPDRTRRRRPSSTQTNSRPFAILSFLMRSIISKRTRTSVRPERILRSTICFTVDWKDEPQGHFSRLSLIWPDTRLSPRPDSMRSCITKRMAAWKREIFSASRSCCDISARSWPSRLKNADWDNPY